MPGRLRVSLLSRVLPPIVLRSEKTHSTLSSLNGAVSTRRLLPLFFPMSGHIFPET